MISIGTFFLRKYNSCLFESTSFRSNLLNFLVLCVVIMVILIIKLTISAAMAVFLFPLLRMYVYNWCFGKWSQFLVISAGNP